FRAPLFAAHASVDGLDVRAGRPCGSTGTVVLGAGYVAGLAGRRAFWRTGSMTRRIVRFLSIAVVLALLVALCLAFAFYRDWPWWAALPLCLGIRACAAVTGACWRKWTTWRLKRRLANAMTPAARRANHAEFDRQWQAGLSVLRQSRYVGQTV